MGKSAVVVLLGLMLAIIALPAQAQIIVPTIPFLPSPTPIPTVTALPTFGAAIPEGPILDTLATAVNGVNALPEDISAPGGVSVLPALNVSTIFNYGKWLFSNQGARELVGPTLSPLVTRVYIAIALSVVLTTIYLTFYMAVMLVRFALWIQIQFIKLLGTVK